MMRKDNSYIAVIIAALDEEEGIGLTLRELRDVLGNPFLLVVDGNSTDGTVKISKALEVEVMLQNGRGKGLAVAQALEHINSDINYIVFIDADYTYPAEYIPKMIETLEKNPDFGMVIGNRFDKAFDFGKAINDTFYFGNRILAFAQHVLNGVKLCDPLSGLRVVRCSLLKGWRPKSSSFDVEAELNFYVEKMGYLIKEIPIQYRPRLGEKKLKLRHGLTILRRILIESLSDKLLGA